jgi:hypothetical protein
MSKFKMQATQDLRAQSHGNALQVDVGILVTGNVSLVVRQRQYNIFPIRPLNRKSPKHILFSFPNV